MNAPAQNPAPADQRRGRVHGGKSAGKKPKSWSRRLRLPLMLAGPLAVLLVGGYMYVTSGRYVSTDDAYVQAARVSISTDISARVTEIAVHDNQHVNKGDLLFRLDDRAFRIAVEHAQAQLAAARLQVEALKATYRQKQADLRSAQDTLTYEEREYDRQKRLLSSGVASQAQFDQAVHALENARQQVASSQQQIANVLASLGGEPDIPAERHPVVQQAQAQLDRANLDLSYTVIAAPDEGTVTKVEQLQVGDYVNAATPVFTLVSTRDVWVEANFKETDLTHMRPGQAATVDIDTYSDKSFKARVVSLSPGTGSIFSLLPPENATGNWVKIVQRLPVRLAIEVAASDMPLHAGLSVTVEVDTRYTRPILSMIQSAFASSEPQK